MSKLSKFANFLIGKKQDYRQVFIHSGRPGERVLNDLLRECQMERNPTVAGDPLSTGVNIGRQLIGHFLKNSLHLSDEEIIRRASAVEEEKPYDDQEIGGEEAHV